MTDTRRPDGRLRIHFENASALGPVFEVTQARIEASLARHPGLALEPVLPEGVPEEWAVAPGGLRTRPDYWRAEGGLDGFYMARLRLQA